MKQIDERYVDLLEKGTALDDKITFRVYKDRSYIGRKILKDLVAKRDGEYTSGDKIYHGYYLTDRNKDVGLLSQLYGANGLFTLINRYNVFNDKKSDETQNDLINGIKSTLYDVLNYVETEGYDLNPYIDDNINNELFHNPKCEVHYIGAMTWALSLFVSAKKALRKGLLTFNVDSEEEAKKATEKLSGRLHKQIKRIIQFFLDTHIDDVGSIGWGYANGCTEPSLFFTYSVIEAYSDFEDNAVIDRDDELLEYLNEGITNEEDRLEIRYRNLCYKVGDRTWETYKHYLKNHFFNDRYTGTAVTTISKEEILNMSRSSVLFNTLYVVFILLYSYTNNRKQRYDKDEQRTEKDFDEIINTITRALQLVQNFYEDMKATGDESIIDRHILSFNQKNALIPNFSKRLNEETIQASPLLPMLVKANNLVAIWILKFPQQSMTDLFDEVLAAKNDSKWLWESKRFDLLSTERFMEAIADYFDYYEEHEKNYADKLLNKTRLQKQLTEKIVEEQEIAYKRRLKDAENDLEKKAMSKIEQQIRAEYTIEPQIDKKIEAVVAKTIDNRIEEMLISALNSINKYNRADTQEKREAIELTEFEEKLRDALAKYNKSHFSNAIRAVCDDRDDIRYKELDAAIDEDMNDFIATYFAFVAKNKTDRFSNRKLSDIFNLIKKS